MHRTLSRGCYATAIGLAFIALGAPVRAQSVQVIEYYNTALDHYFITSLQPDIDALDSGKIFGWSRTGFTFQAFADQASRGPGVNPACRFYIPPPADSHFFSASLAECASVLSSISNDPNYRSFVYETPNAFYIALPDLAIGACAAGAVPVYRLWNQRSDSNHRYTADPATRAQMIAKGYVAEGYGPDGVAMCATAAANTDTNVRVSGFSPLTSGCDGTAATGTRYVGAEVEPMVALDPANSSHLIGVWQQDRWSDGGAAGQFTGVSFDGGRTWSRTSAPLSRCTGGNAANGGDYPRVSDPWVTIAADGTAYQSAIAFGGATFAPNSFGAIVVSRSVDGGRTWGQATALLRDGAAFFNDKDSITADPTNGHFVYATWERVVGSESGSAPTWFARTTDAGATWEPARSIYDPGPTSSTLNNQIVVMPDGTLVLFFSEFNTVRNQTAVLLRVIRSQDKGATWSPPVTIAQSLALGTVWPESNEPIRDGANLGSIAVGKNGVLAVAWQDSRFSGGVRDGIAFSLSRDGGLTWNAPAQVNSVPRVQALLPTVAIRDDGTIGLTYYDFRNHAPGDATLATDYWLITSAEGTNWRESHVGGTFDLGTAPFALGLFLGDYQALASIGSAFVPFYVTTNANSPTNMTDVFAARATQPMPIRTSVGVDTGRGLHAVVAPAIEMAPEMQQSLSDAARRTLQQRRMGQSGPSVIPMPTIDTP